MFTRNLHWKKGWKGWKGLKKCVWDIFIKTVGKQCPWMINQKCWNQNLKKNVTLSLQSSARLSYH